MTPPEPPSFDDLVALVARFPPAAPKSLHAHPYAVEALRDMSTPAVPDPRPGAIGSLTGIPVILDDEMAPGAWEIREGDTVISSGVVRSKWADLFGPDRTEGEPDA